MTEEEIMKERFYPIASILENRRDSETFKPKDTMRIDLILVITEVLGLRVGH